MRVSDEIRAALGVAAVSEHQAALRWAKIAFIEKLRMRRFVAPDDKLPKRPMRTR